MEWISRFGSIMDAVSKKIRCSVLIGRVSILVSGQRNGKIQHRKRF